MTLDIRVVRTDDDYEAWRRVRLAVLPHERSDTVEQLRRSASRTRLLLLAYLDGELAGHGSADLSQVGGRASVTPRVLPAFRRRGVGTALLRTLADHAATLAVDRVSAVVDIPGTGDGAGSIAFAERFGFAEVDRQVEQVRAIGTEPDPGPPPHGLRIVTTADEPDLWPACFDTFGREVLADFATDTPMAVDAREWADDWPGDPMYLALDNDVVVGCAGLIPDTDKRERAEHALTAVSRSWRGRGLASYLKRLTLHWAATHDVSEVYTWTQRGNASMRGLNAHLGYANGQTAVVLTHPLPL